MCCPLLKGAANQAKLQALRERPSLVGTGIMTGEAWMVEGSQLSKADGRNAVLRPGSNPSSQSFRLMRSQSAERLAPRMFMGG